MHNHRIADELIIRVHNSECHVYLRKYNISNIIVIPEYRSGNKIFMIKCETLTDFFDN